MHRLLSKSEIEELLKEVELSFKLPSIIDITPVEINNIKDDATRKNMERNFYLINELFVMPLHKLLNNHINSVNSSKKNYAYDFSAYSLKQRMRLISKNLLIYGYTPFYLRSLLPQTVEEVDKKVEELERQHAIQVIASINRSNENRRVA